MSSFPPWDGNLPTDILVDVGALCIGANSVTPPPLLGRTKGGLTFDPARDVKAEDFDGMRAVPVGMDRVTNYASTIKGKFLQVGHLTLSTIEPGLGSLSGSGQVATVYAPKTSSAFFVAGDYLTDLRLIYRRAPGAASAFFQIRFHKALVMKYNIVGKDKTALEVDCEFHARIDMTAANPFNSAVATLDDPPYLLEELYAGAFP